jgi:tRNA A37 threonylcarbamoyladenosine modification protein TsaB
VLPAEGWLCAALDARRDEVYYQCFGIERGALRTDTPASDATVTDLVRQLAGTLPRPLVLTGEASTKVAAGLAAAGEKMAAMLLPEPHSRCTAVTVALLGAGRLARGETDDTAALEPRYIKEFFLKNR